ncbi:tryptophan synthase subunit beta [Corynebacterium sp.]|uniref:tryptophan synthase subunit beta n=1 Tax=Corynebacterium sp. TaxID=1720 RepID=UPI0026DFF17F|nr:tryptophan synthase subunit beta [Corynebacterium sp.]MDO5513422.1 tryptophan synthase subunit beta [Corynebacterium sp.]
MNLTPRLHDNPEIPEGEARETILPAYFGKFGGQFVPPMLYPVLDELERAYAEALEDPEFIAELDTLYRSYLGRPTPVTECVNLPREGKGRGHARIFLKREDLVHGGAHKGNQVMAQALLARKLGKTRLIAETGAGQHGTATAMAAARFGMDCTIYMGARDIARQQANVYRMRLMGAEVIPVDEDGGNGLQNAVDVALLDWVESYETTHYLLGTAAGPHPFPSLVKEYHRVISKESREQMLAEVGRLPDAVIAAVGGGSNAIGAFAEYLDDADVQLIGVEPAGEGLDTDKHGAPLNRGRVGILHGSRSYVMLGEGEEDVLNSHSISAGLDYPGVGPEHAHLLESGRGTYVGSTDAEALQAFRMLTRYEGIIPALESSHALAYALKLAEEDEAAGRTDRVYLVNLSGRGDKDVNYVRRMLGDAADLDPDEHGVEKLDVAGAIAALEAEAD